MLERQGGGTKEVRGLGETLAWRPESFFRGLINKVFLKGPESKYFRLVGCMMSAATTQQLLLLEPESSHRQWTFSCSNKTLQK